MPDDSEELTPHPWSPSFDHDSVRKQLSSTDVEQAIIRAHLWTEHFLVQIINDGLPRSGTLDLDRLTYVIKVQLAVSLAVLPHELAAPLTCLNALRNKAVHKLDYKFSEADKRSLFYSMPKHVQKMVLEHDDFQSLSFSVILRSIVFLLDSIRHFNQEEKRIRRERMKIFRRDHWSAVEKAFLSADKKPPDWIYEQ